LDGAFSAFACSAVRDRGAARSRVGAAPRSARGKTPIRGIHDAVDRINLVEAWFRVLAAACGSLVLAAVDARGLSRQGRRRSHPDCNSDSVCVGSAVSARRRTGPRWRCCRTEAVPWWHVRLDVSGRVGGSGADGVSSHVVGLPGEGPVLPLIRPFGWIQLCGVPVAFPVRLISTPVTGPSPDQALPRTV
jgi:hypothetical protein